jgi:CRISPR-associated protein Cmr6
MKWRLPRFSPWDTPFPLPRDTAQVVLEQDGASANLGLTMDRLLAYEESRQQVRLVREFTDRRALLPDTAAWSDLITAWYTRWRAAAETMQAVLLQARPEWRLLLGSATHNILDVGLILHPLYGVPIVPASAIKGLVRRYAEAVDDAPTDLVTRLLGVGGEEAEQGELIFLEGVPTAPPRLERDVTNPHFGAYYTGSSAPVELVNPRPFFFLAVGQNSRYAFGVASRSRDASCVEQGADWLRRGLQEIGLGAKTSAGYGYWVVEEAPMT